MWGAEATEQGNCTRFRRGQLPHCCEKQPEIVDLMVGAPYNLQVSNCCKGGLLTSLIQDPTKHIGGNLGSAQQTSLRPVTVARRLGWPDPFMGRSELSPARPLVLGLGISAWRTGWT
ncbi:COBRA-like protein [Trema orientale]|uniref:COBRA-like protein n=1 Tax=Trema orientale TaxID=63057 RepID=A0A2P5CAS5_TREOI|nr:COBRA-like protein [Trema orientale]